MLEKELPERWKDSESHARFLEYMEKTYNSPSAIPINKNVPYTEGAKKFLRSGDLIVGEFYQITKWRTCGKLLESYRAVYTGYSYASQAHAFKACHKDGKAYIGVITIDGVALDYGTVRVRYTS